MKTQRNQQDNEQLPDLSRAKLSRIGQHTATTGFLLFSAFAPHSIAGAEIVLAIAGAGWLTRTIGSGRSGLRRTPFDAPILLFFAWTVLSCFLSPEPGISIRKIQSTCVIFVFYFVQATVTKRTAILLVAVMIASGAAGTAFSLFDIVRGRGIVVETIAPESPFQTLGVRPGDAIWRIGGRRVYSIADIDQEIRNAPAATSLTVSLISQGEHIERPNLIVSDALKSRSSPSGITGSHATHRFRASGWTRHYETYSEILQLLTQLGFGLGLAHFRNHGLNLRAKLALATTAFLAIGISLTAMRTTLVALAIGVCVISFRAQMRRARLLPLAAISAVLVFGAFVVYQTRAHRALWLQDSSSSLRLQVARVGLSRIMLHPLFGHGMDSMKLHWTEWGFPGKDMLHLHSTPLQLAFDRGLPAVVLWLWLMWTCWRTALRSERSFRDTTDTNRHGVLLGATGAIAGFFASSLVNYNWGDGEVALVFWWLMGIVVVLAVGKEPPV